MEKVLSTINDIIWNPGLVGLLLLAGLYFSIRTRMVQVRRFGLMLRSLFGKKEGDNGISSFEAFCLALSGRVGTGNIVGVATAIAYGGPGAVFWMWVVAWPSWAPLPPSWNPPWPRSIISPTPPVTAAAPSPSLRRALENAGWEWSSPSSSSCAAASS